MTERQSSIWRVEGALIRLQGDLDERASADEMQNILQEAWEARGEQETVAVVFDHKARANSCGLASWLRVAKSAGARLRYVECPPWLVTELSRLCELLDMNSDIESIVAPYYIPDSDKKVKRLLRVEDDLATLPAYAEDNLVILEDGQELHPDFEPAEYLRFMTRLNTLGKVRPGK